MNSTTGLSLLQLNMDDATVILNFTAISSVGLGFPPKPSATECDLFYYVNSYEASYEKASFQSFALLQIHCRMPPVQVQEPHKTFL